MRIIHTQYKQKIANVTSDGGADETDLSFSLAGVMDGASRIHFLLGLEDPIDSRLRFLP